MNLIQLIACIGLITGCFVLLHISPMDFTEGVFRRITSKPKSIQGRRLMRVHGAKRNPFCAGKSRRHRPFCG